MIDHVLETSRETENAHTLADPDGLKLSCFYSLSISLDKLGCHTRSYLLSNLCSVENKTNNVKKGSLNGHSVVFLFHEGKKEIGFGKIRIRRRWDL